ncbi:phosphoenolpyruvate synthase [Vibrio sp. JC009]|uniref:phosphoenolpyruvate synthase n=1 Tax=Vibrio sp. JC009 TaxID=2912314 RepID=UPI0023AE7852|nr:phosphoenolpyruvate synthase [Vibrio sp. JC009]WED24453.1 phosphoenolpyruvate synthase [Vibrio sp. JC009]
MANNQYIRWFNELTISDVPIVGGKNASLGELSSLLKSSPIRLPDGFALTAQAYRDFLKHNQLEEQIYPLLDSLDKNDLDALKSTASKVRELILSGSFTAEMKQQITEAYSRLEEQYGENTDVAVRSSATAEDLPNASFAGQQESYLNVTGAEDVLYYSQRVLASLFTDRAISYRIDQGFEHRLVALSVGVQKMVRSDLGSAGVMFTLDTESGFRDLILISSAWGLGENVVQGSVSPDEFFVFKPLLQGENRPIVKRHLGDKAIKMVYQAKDPNHVTTKNIQVPDKQRSEFSISSDDVLALAKTATFIEEHYSEKAGRDMPMDIEWAKDGETGSLFILQARPETVHSQQSRNVLLSYKLNNSGNTKPIVTGKSVGKKIASGHACVISDCSEMDKIRQGEVLVSDITDPDWEPIMKKASAIVTNRGGRVCHAAIIARELGIPAIVGTGNGTEVINDGDELTISCAEGDEGFVYPGTIPFTVSEHEIDFNRRPETKMMLNVADPHMAFEFAQLPNDGVGLARLEFIINNMIGMHPKALLEFDKLDDSLQQKISQRISGYDSPVRYYVDRLAEGIGAICAAFYPKPVIIRFSDFKSNEYSSLLGGQAYEPNEENPMIGFRGTGRYFDPCFADCFALECEAVKFVRETQGLTNLAVMLPFVRTPEDLVSVQALMAKNGLKRGENGLKLYTMCEIPSNVILAERFLEHCDGFSIGSNDLTQLTLGVDRDSGLLTQYDERHEAVTRMLKLAIEACRKADKYVGICGQAPSDFPEITAWLVEQGISSISLNPDSVITMTDLVLGLESGS